MHHPVGCKLSSERRNSLENSLIQKSPKICPKYNELIEIPPFKEKESKNPVISNNLNFVRKKAIKLPKVVGKMTVKVAKVVGKMYFCTQKSILFMMLRRRISETLRKWKE